MGEEIAIKTILTVALGGVGEVGATLTILTPDVGFELVDGAGEPGVEVGEETQRRGDFRSGENANALDVIVELLLRQRSNDRRNGRKGAVNVFVRVKNVDFKLDFLIDRRRVDEKTTRDAERDRETLRNFAQFGVRPPGQTRVKGRLLHYAELTDALEKAALRPEETEKEATGVASASVGGGEGRVFIVKISAIVKIGTEEERVGGKRRGFGGFGERGRV